jgi:parallel beta-helix repeat protein
MLTSSPECCQISLVISHWIISVQMGGHRMTSKRRLMTPWFFAHFLMALILCPVIVFAATIRVPTDQPTIQAGIDAAVAGDTVLVADGTYTGEGNRDIDFKGKAITVQSENGAESCIIDCEDYSVRGFYFHNDETQSSVLDGFTVTKSNLAGSSAIYCMSSPKIINCHIKNNNNDGIIFFESGILKDCQISENSGDGLTFYSCDENTSVDNCDIINNYGKGIYLNSYGGMENKFTISNCKIKSNKGTAIYIGSSDVTIYKCIIEDNDSWGFWIYGSNPIIKSCIVKNNKPGIIISSYSAPRIENCLITNNTDILDGAGIQSGESSSSPTIINCTIAENTSSYGDYGGVYFKYGNPLVKNTIIWGNTPSDNYIEDDKVTYSDVSGYLGGGQGNLDEDPLFVSAEDFNLQDGSPCLDTGTASGAPNTDIDGTPRPQGNGYDMGAYETDGTGSFGPTANAGPDQRVFDSITLDGSQSTDPDGTITSYLWQLKYQGNSSYDRTATGVTPAVTTLQPGYYDVTLTVTDNQGLTDTDAMLFSAIGIKGDFNGDGDVDGSDLQIFSTNYGK